MSLRGLIQKLCPCCPCCEKGEGSERLVKGSTAEEAQRHRRKVIGFSIAAVVAVLLTTAIIVLAVILLAPTTSWRWVAYITSVGKVSIIDIERQSVVATVPAGTYPYGVAITPNGREAWAISDTNVLVIDTQSYGILETIAVSSETGAILLAIAITPNGEEAYVTRDSVVIVISIQTRKIVSNITVDPYPYAIDITSDGEWACVTSLGTNTLSFIDTEWKTVNETMPISSPMSIVIYGEEAFVSSIDTVFVVNINNRTINATIPVDENGNLLQGMTITSDGKWLYVSNEANRSVAVIETATRTVNITIPVQGPPSGVALTSDDKELYVTSTDNYIYVFDVFDTNNVTMIWSSLIGTNPYAVTIALVAQ
jgi:YVTN family beta-propeller protein